MCYEFWSINQYVRAAYAIHVIGLVISNDIVGIYLKIFMQMGTHLCAYLHKLTYIYMHTHTQLGN